LLQETPLLHRRIATLLALAALLGSWGAVRCFAQAARAAAPAVAADNRISAQSAPYRIEWSGTSGVFTRKAFDREPEQRQPLAFLHTDAGPTGFAKHLAWFLARDEAGFSLLWCYLNESGTDFDCWLYRFPSNQLTSLHFTGTYQFAPPPEPAPAATMTSFKLTDVPHYIGPAFTYRNWTTRVGALPQLDLKAIKPTAGPPVANSASPVAKTVTQLRVIPLHQVEVGASNGWREGGWNELHALAFDAAEDPYYLILYSNTPNGYVVDLKRAQIYTADYGTKVTFPDAPQAGTGDNPLDVEPSIKVRRYDRYEITLTTSEKSANPFVDIQVGIEFHGPDAKPVVVPGFWDGGGTFKVRFSPTLRGRWSWKSLSQTPDLNGQTGTFECISEEQEEKGFVGVLPNHKDTRHFGYANGDAFLPVFVREPQPAFVTVSPQERTGPAAVRGVRAAALSSSPAPDDTASFLAFQKFVDAAAQRGFNRFVGGALLGPAAAKLVRSNEGGAAFDGTDLNRINPEFFKWMDRRVAYCNARGIVPDIGVGTLDDALFAAYKPAALYRFWAYVVARYAAFDVQWNLFDAGDNLPSAATRKAAEQFAELTRLYDPNRHPITAAVPGGTAPIAPPITQAAPGRPAGAAAPSVAQGSSSAIGGAPVTAKQSVPYDLTWEDVITVLGGDVNALPYYGWLTKPLVLVERATLGSDAALSPDVTRHRMWESRMRGVYWSPGAIPTPDPASLNAPGIQYARYCAALFRRTRFYRLTPRPDMLGGPAESAADRRRRKKAEAEAARRNPPTEDDPLLQGDFDPFDPDALAPPLAPPPPKPTRTFVLADPAREYVVYFEEGGTLLLDLLEATGRIQVTWFNPRTGEFGATKQIFGGDYVSFTAPDTNDWVLYVSRL
jgi:hypothetical protein